MNYSALFLLFLLYVVRNGVLNLYDFLYIIVTGVLLMIINLYRHELGVMLSVAVFLYAIPVVIWNIWYILKDPW